MEEAIKKSRYPQGLEKRIMLRIKKEQKISAVKHISILSILIIVFAVSAAPLFNILKADILSSGFLQFLSLIFTDTNMVLAFWQDFSLALLGAMPAVSLILFLAVILALIGLAKLLSKEIKNILIIRLKTSYRI